MLRAHVKELAQMSSEEQTDEWENELSDTIHRLDNALLLRECEEELKESAHGVSTDKPLQQYIVHNVPELDLICSVKVVIYP